MASKNYSTGPFRGRLNRSQLESRGGLRGQPVVICRLGGGCEEHLVSRTRTTGRERAVHTVIFR